MRTPREGFHEARQHVQGDAPTSWQARIGSAASLTDLLEEYVFFTHGPLFCFARFDKDPVYDFFADQDEEIQVAHLDFPDPIFEGLAFRGDEAWNYRLLLIEKKYWTKLNRFLCHVSGIDRKRRKFFKVFVQKIPVVDALAMAKMAVLPAECPMVDVFTYSVSGNNVFGIFEVDENAK
jgi:hypothetical protein